MKLAVMATSRAVGGGDVITVPVTLASGVVDNDSDITRWHLVLSGVVTGVLSGVEDNEGDIIVGWDLVLADVWC